MKLFKQFKGSYVIGELKKHGISITQQCYSNWATGKRKPGTDKIVPLSKIFRVSVEELLTEINQS